MEGGELGIYGHVCYIASFKTAWAIQDPIANKTKQKQASFFAVIILEKILLSQIYLCSQNELQTSHNFAYTSQSKSPCA